MRVMGYALGADGSTMYRTAVGEFFVYPTDKGHWRTIWEPRAKGRRFNDIVAKHDTRQGAVEWIESALSFA